MQDICIWQWRDPATEGEAGDGDSATGRLRALRIRAAAATRGDHVLSLSHGPTTGGKAAGNGGRSRRRRRERPVTKPAQHAG